MASTADLVPPVDGLDLLVDGHEFLLVRIQDRRGERIRVGIRDSSVRLLLAVRPRLNRARFYAVLLGVIASVAIAFLLPVGIGLPPLLGLALALGVGLVGLVAVMLAQPRREYAFHDDLPGGLERPPLMTMAERSGQQSWFALRDENGRMFGDISRRLGRWRVRGFEPLDPPEPEREDPSEALGFPHTATRRDFAARIEGWGAAASEEGPDPKMATTEVAVTIVRDYLNLASLIGGMLSGPIGIALAFNGPWKRMEFRRNGSLVATGHCLDDGQALRLDVEPGFDMSNEQDAWLDRRHLLALAVLTLSFEADR